MADEWVEKIVEAAKGISQETRDKYVHGVLKGAGASALEKQLGLTNDQACGIVYLFARGSNEPADAQK